MITNLGSPLTDDQFQQLTSLVSGLNRDQIIWSSGYLAGATSQSTYTNTESNAIQTEQQTDIINNTDKSSTKALTIIYGSRTGNGEMLAKKMEET